MTTSPLMPKATAVWLVENTVLTFRQISNFCSLHELEIQAIADGDVAYNIVGISPVINGQLTLEEIKRCEEDKATDLIASELEKNVKERNKKARKVLSPSQRSAKSSCILWILKNYPEIIDSQICKLIGTTKPTILKVKNGEVRDASSLRPQSPITIGLCREQDVVAALNYSKKYTENKTKKAPVKKAVKKVEAKKAPVKKEAKKATVKKETKKAPVKKAVKKPATKKTSDKKK